MFNASMSFISASCKGSEGEPVWLRAWMQSLDHRLNPRPPLINDVQYLHFGLEIVVEH